MPQYVCYLRVKRLLCTYKLQYKLYGFVYDIIQLQPSCTALMVYKFQIHSFHHVVYVVV